MIIYVKILSKNVIKWYWNSSNRKIPVFLGNENKKFQISKIADGARNIEYVGVVEWLANAGIGSLDEEVQDDLRNNENMNTYKGALYENIVSDMLVKEGYDLYFYRDDSKKIEMDFMVRDKNSFQKHLH